MTDKKKKFKPSEPGSSFVPRGNLIPETVPGGSLVPFGFTDEELSTHFPNVTGEYHGFAVLKDLSELLGYLIAEPVGNVLSLHIWIPAQKRSKEGILALKAVLWSEVKPWADSLGMTLLATCPADLPKTKALLETFGFTLSNIWVGVLKDKEE